MDGGSDKPEPSPLCRIKGKNSCWMLWQRRAGLAAALVGVSSQEELVWTARGSHKARGEENIKS